MIKRALLIGTLLAGLTGAAVYYGLGETGGATGENVFTHETSTATAVEKSGNSAEVSALPDSKPMKPKSVISVTPETQSQAGDKAKADTGATKSSNASLKALLDKDDKAEAYGSGNHEAPKDDASEAATKTDKNLMKPRATGSYIVSETPRDDTKDKMAAEGNAATLMMTGELNKNFKAARRITNKTTRDKIYLEIFDNAITDGNMDLAQRIGGKLSTPELRKTARAAIAKAAE